MFYPLHMLSDFSYKNVLLPFLTGALHIYNIYTLYIYTIRSGYLSGSRIPLFALFVWHFLFAHVKAHVAFRSRCTRQELESLRLIMALSFEVGDTFSSYEEFKDRVEEFEKVNFVQCQTKSKVSQA